MARATSIAGAAEVSLAPERAALQAQFELELEQHTSDRSELVEAQALTEDRAEHQVLEAESARAWQQGQGR